MVISLELTRLAAWAVPLKVTVEEERNPVPAIVKVCEAAPTSEVLGDNEVMLGAGLLVEGLLFIDPEPPPQPLKAPAEQSMVRIPITFQNLLV
jgi:hypothetical protein